MGVIIARIETRIRKLSQYAAEEDRRKTAQIYHIYQKGNISREERMVLRILNYNKDIITPAVVLDVSDYTQKIRDLLDLATYKKIHRDPFKNTAESQRADQGLNHTSR